MVQLSDCGPGPRLPSSNSDLHGPELEPKLGPSFLQLEFMCWEYEPE